MFSADTIFSYDDNEGAIIGVNTENRLKQLLSLKDSGFALLPHGLGYVIWVGIILFIWFAWNFIGFKENKRRLLLCGLIMLLKKRRKH